MNPLIKKNIFEILLILIWLLIILIVNPWGEFPINDDWAYSKVVYHLIHEGEFRMGDWPAMTLVAQSLWGTLFCKIFGFSFNALRLSTIVSSFLSTFLIYYLSKEISGNKKLSFFIALAWLINPIYFNLSFTFMTEVHFLFFSLLSLFFYFKYLKHDKLFYLVIGTFFVLAAIFTRQLGIILPFAFGIVLLVKSKKNIKNFFISFIPLAVSYSALSLYISRLKATGNLPGSFDTGDHLLKFFNENNFSFFYSRFGLVLFYISFLFIPALFIIIPYFKITNLKRKIIFVLAASAILVPAMYTAWGSFPCGNTLHSGGLGPRLLKDTCHGENIYQLLTENILSGIKISCMVSLIILIFFLINGIKGIQNYLRDISSSPVRLLKLCCSIAFTCYMGFTVFNPNYFDRYCLPLILFLLITIVPVNGNFLFSKSLPGIILLIAFGLFSIFLTHDYFAWNRARWQALNYLMKEKKIKPDQIDGGFEFNCWFETKPSSWEESSGKSWYVTQDDFVISSGPISGFQKIKKFPYQRFVPPGKDFIYILVHKTN